MADGAESLGHGDRFGYDDALRARDLLIERMRERGMDPDALKEMLILGSGLGHFAADHMEREKKGSVSGPLVLSFDEIWKVLGIEPLKEKVKGHENELVVGPVKGTDATRLVLAESGREHPYQGVSTQRATLWLRMAQLMKVKTLLGSNAAGIVTPDTLKQHDLMLINGHKDAGKDNPLRGPNDERFGIRFPHMGDYYPEASRKVIRLVAARLGIDLKEGTYMREPGPNFESVDDVYDLANQVDAIWKRGANVWHDPRYVGKKPVAGVGMSTTFEALVAQHAFLQEMSKKDPVFANRAWVSVMTNFAAMLGADPNGGVELEHGHVAEAAEVVREDFGRLVKGALVEFREMEEAA